MSITELLWPLDAGAFTTDLLAKIGASSPDLIYAKDLKSRMIFANPAVLAVLGKSWEEIRGKSDDEWHTDPVEGQKFVEADARIMASGETEKLEEILTGAGGPQIYLSTKSPLLAEDGRVIGMFGISMNITERKNAEKMQSILTNELDHRVKNMLALVQAMVHQTFKNVGIERSVWDIFEGRLLSMSQAHDLLTRQHWVGADIAEVVAEGLVAHGGDRAECFTISGPPAWVDAQTALALTMAFHELGTNAIKYGALSVPAGRVTICWQVDNAVTPAILDIFWKEDGGPSVVAPTRKGFGTRLIQQAFGHTGPDVAEVHYHPGGVEFHARFTVQERMVKSAAGRIANG